MNFEELGGISKSLLTNTAIIPSTKNRRAGFVKFSRSKLKFMSYVGYCFVFLKNLGITYITIAGIF